MAVDRTALHEGKARMSSATPETDPGPRLLRRVEAGAGEPAVVLEAGLNNGAASWQRVMPLLAPHVRVAAYDRAGLGGNATTGRCSSWKPPGTGKRRQRSGAAGQPGQPPGGNALAPPRAGRLRRVGGRGDGDHLLNVLLQHETRGCGVRGGVTERGGVLARPGGIAARQFGGVKHARGAEEDADPGGA